MTPWRCKYCVWEQFCKRGECVSFISKESIGVPPILRGSKKTGEKNGK